MQYPRKKSFAAELLEKRKKKRPSAILVVAVIVAVIAVGYALYMRYGIKEVPTEEVKSIAVLPFNNLSADEEQEYFCDGLAETILNALTYVEGLHVKARTSSFAFKGKEVSIREIGRQLDVETVLEGSVLKSGNRLLITAQLINVADETHIFSNQYERELEDIFNILNEISLAVVNELKVKLLDQEKAAIEKRYTENSEAYNLYLMGRYHWEMRTKEGAEIALDCFNKAIDIDPDYALAYTGIADTYHNLGSWGVMPSKIAYSKAKKASIKALELDNTLAEAYISLAIINTWYDWDPQSAKYNLDQALKFNPGNSRIYYRYSTYYQVTRQFEKSIETRQRAMELDPLRSVIYQTLIGAYCRNERYDEAWELLDRYVKMLPKEVNRHNISRGEIYLSKGNYKDAIVNYEKMINKGADLGYAYGMAGEKEKAEQIINKLKESKAASTQIAAVYLGMGENDKVFEWLEKAYEDREPTLIMITLSLNYDNLRSDPRFKILLKKIGFPED